MKISLISDTHTLHREVDVPPCEILIHAGDICFMGRSARDLDDFAEWLSEQPAQYRVIVPGNHDGPIMQEPDIWRKRLSVATLLINESHVKRGHGPERQDLRGIAAALAIAAEVSVKVIPLS
jgi:predicted phosphodiesterase